MQTRASGGDDIRKKIGDKFSEIENNCGKDYPEIYFYLTGNYYQLTGYGKCLWDAIEKYYSTGNIYQKSEKWGGTAFHAIIVTFSVVKVGTLTTAITHFDPIYLTLSTTLKIVKPLIVNGIKAFRCGTKFVTFTGENNTFVLRFLESKGEAFTGDWQQAIRWVEVTDKAGNKYRVGLIGDDLPIRNSPEFNSFDIVRNPDGTPIQVEGQRFLAEISDGQEGHLAVVERLAKTGSYLDNLPRYQQLFKEGKVLELFSELKKTTAFPKMGETRVRNFTDLEAEYFTKYGSDAKNFPYSKTKPVTDFKLEETGYFVRVYSGESAASSWIFRIEDLRGYKNVDEIVEKLALPGRPTKIGLVELPEGVKLRKSDAGPQNWANGTTPQGGGIQYEIIGDRSNEWFKPLFDNIDDFFK